MTYKETGPEVYAPTGENPEQQRRFYDELQAYKLDDALVGSSDYFLVGTCGKVKMYAPNDETWGAIIAVSHDDMLASETGFYEVVDLVSDSPYDDYNQVVHNGTIVCKFQTEEY